MKLKELLKNNLCIGCGICNYSSEVEVEFGIFDDKFLAPKISVDSASAEFVLSPSNCPGASVEIQLRAREDNEHLWGRIESVGKTYSCNPDVRKSGSSGGTITEIVTQLLKMGAVDSAYQLKSSGDSPFVFSAGCISSPEEVIKYAGSKYTLSPTLGEFQLVLDSPSNLKWVVVAKPCEISAVRNIIESSSSLEIDNFVLISFFCAGLPSLAANKRLSENLGVDPEDVKNIIYRGNGCPGKTIITGHDGVTASTDYHSAWGLTLGRDIHPRCKICPDGIGLDADIVCADVWDVDDQGYPSFEESDGFSLAIARTDKGLNILKDLTQRNKIYWEPYDITRLKLVQPAQYYRRTTLAYRIAAMKILGKTVPKITGASVNKAKKFSKLSRKISSFLGILKRQLNPCSK